MENRKKRVSLSLSEREALIHELLECYYVNHGNISAFSAEKGISRRVLYNWIRTFEVENPQICEQMKKQGKEITPEDYKKLVQENLELKKRLSQERLRADFYEEMVAFGKEVYAIDFVC